MRSYSLYNILLLIAFNWGKGITAAALGVNHVMTGPRMPPLTSKGHVNPINGLISPETVPMTKLRRLRRAYQLEDRFSMDDTGLNSTTTTTQAPTLSTELKSATTVFTNDCWKPGGYQVEIERMLDDKLTLSQEQFLNSRYEELFNREGQFSGITADGAGVILNLECDDQERRLLGILSNNEVARCLDAVKDWDSDHFEAETTISIKRNGIVYVQGGFFLLNRQGPPASLLPCENWNHEGKRVSVTALTYPPGAKRFSPNREVRLLLQELVNRIDDKIRIKANLDEPLEVYGNVGKQKLVITINMPFQRYPATDLPTPDWSEWALCIAALRQNLWSTGAKFVFESVWQCHYKNAKTGETRLVGEGVFRALRPLFSLSSEDYNETLYNNETLVSIA